MDWLAIVTKGTDLMRHLLFAACLATAFFLALAPSRAETVADDLSAADLKTICSDAGSDSKICSTYIAGFSQGFYYASMSAKIGFAPCIPRGVTEDQARLIVTKFMGLHAEMMQQRAPSVVAEALIDAFPCANTH
jgi:hypothetical protein